MKALPSLKLTERYWKNIEQEIKNLLDVLLYEPFARALEVPKKEIENSTDDLITAIQKGTIWYQDGRFFGSFSAATSRRLLGIGARYNQKSNTWSLMPESLPSEIRIAQAGAVSRYDAMRKRLLTTLDDINIDSINAVSSIPDRYIQTIDWMESDFQKAVRKISIPPKLTPEQRGIIAAEWGQNLDKYIKDWAQESILELRGIVQANAFEGQRAENLIKLIRKNYQVSRNKARFLARQETSLLMSKFRETRYRDIGSTKYRWSGTLDERERPDHKALQGQIFSWDSPPVVDRRTGRRANPGEDYGCRCVAVPLIE